MNHVNTIIVKFPDSWTVDKSIFENTLKHMVDLTPISRGDTIIVDNREFTVYKKRVSLFNAILWITYEFVVGAELPEHKSWSTMRAYQEEDEHPYK